MAVTLPLFLLLLAMAGCGGMSTDEYQSSIWEIHQEAGEELTVLFQDFTENIEAGDVKSNALESLELAQEMRLIFDKALGKLNAIKAPKELAYLHEELLEYYQEGVSLSEDLEDAYDHLYEMSGILEEFLSQGVTVLNLDLANAAASEIVSAIDQDIASLTKLSREISSAPSGGSLMEGFDNYLADFFSQLAGTMAKYKDAIRSNQPGARSSLEEEMAVLLQGFDQQMGEGLPGLGELLKQRDELGIRGYELNDEINAL